jgi:hypothetical protein
MISFFGIFGIIIGFAILLTWGMAVFLRELAPPPKKRRGRAMRVRRTELY